MPVSNKNVGQLGEKIAERYLGERGYQILDRNYSEKLLSGPSRGEIDIIAKKDGTIIFVEVKTLANNYISKDFLSGISPEEKVGWQKQRRIIKASQSWLAKNNKEPFNSKWQIDVIAINIDLSSKKAKIRHFENAVC